ncbi:hypothetical protein BH11VER1_BH11VER1_18190 [soil metagenome]
MKTSVYPKPVKSAFTLIELLIVLTIIAVLAGLGLAAYGIALEKARALKAKSAIAGLLIAIKGYQTEYNRYPISTGKTSDVTINTAEAEGIAFLKSLLANDAIDNPKRSKFYEVPGLAKNGINGYDAATGALFDPWGNGYEIVIDYDQDGKVKTPYPVSDGAPEIPMGTIIYSAGRNRTIDDGPTKTDDLKSW